MLPRPPRPITQEWLEEAYKKGMVAMKDLKDGCYYSGRCRNASVAKWDAKKERFTYMRTKFCDRFPEDIQHPENDNYFDLFIPMAEVKPESHQIV